MFVFKKFIPIWFMEFLSIVFYVLNKNLIIKKSLSCNRNLQNVFFVFIFVAFSKSFSDSENSIELEGLEDLNLNDDNN